MSHAIAGVTSYFFTSLSLRTYKVTPRNQNAKAYVNGAMLASVATSGGQVTVQDKPNIVLGGISGNFSHADTLEDYLVRSYVT